jgi:precorrin-2 dehydrogenase/sirohydrochlorin ferrochelatase
MNVYPICLVNLRERVCVVVGGGRVAERRVGALLECQARVTVISPTLTPELRRWAEAGKLKHVARSYRDGDLEGAFLCIAATNDRAVNEQVWREGNARGVLVNTVDPVRRTDGDASHSHFIVPAVVRRGDLTIAVSTGGLNPALAARIKEEIASLFGPEYGDLLQILGDLRPRLIAELPPERRRAFADAVLDADIASLLRTGDRAGALARIEEIFESCKGQGE